MMHRNLFIVFDLDGTLAFNDHRKHFVEGRPNAEKDWAAFYAACDKDTPNWPIIRLAQFLDATGNDVHIWSGRSDEVAAKTVTWLGRYGIGHIPLRTRSTGDFTPDEQLKLQWMEESSRKPDLVFDDRDKVVKMWRDNGVTCAQVAPGAF